MTTELEKLAERLDAASSHGLVDIKFQIRNASEATTEQVYREVNDMMNAHERGESVPLDFKDSRRGKGEHRCL